MADPKIDSTAKKVVTQQTESAAPASKAAAPPLTWTPTTRNAARSGSMRALQGDSSFASVAQGRTAAPLDVQPGPGPTPELISDSLTRDQATQAIIKDLNLPPTALAALNALDPDAFSRMRLAANQALGWNDGIGRAPPWEMAITTAAVLPASASQYIAQYAWTQMDPSIRTALQQTFNMSQAQFAQSGPAMTPLLSAAQDIAAGDWGSALDKAKTLYDNHGAIPDLRPFAKDLMNKVYQGWDKGLHDKMASFGVNSGDDLFNKFGRNANVVSQAINRLKNNDWGGALASISAVDDALGSSDVGTAIAQDAYGLPTAKPLDQALKKLGVNSAQDLASYGKGAYATASAADQLINHRGNWGGDKESPGALDYAAQVSPEFANTVAGYAYDHVMNGTWHKELGKLGINRSDVFGLGASSIHVFRALDNANTGKWGDFVRELQAAGPSAGALGALKDKLVAQLPGYKGHESAFNSLKDANGNPVQFTTDDLISLGDSIPQALNVINDLKSGTPDALADAATQLSAIGNTSGSVLNKLGQALLQKGGISQDTQNKLAKLGLNSDNLAIALGAVPAAIAVVNDLTASPKDLGKTVQDLGQLVGSLPDGLRQQVMTAIFKNFPNPLGKIPSGFTDALVAGGEALLDPAVRKDFADAFTQGIQQKNPAAFLNSLAAAGKQIANHDQDAATKFLNALGQLPGTAGQLFQDTTLNAKLVSSGAMGQVFAVAQDIANSAGRPLQQSLGQMISDIASGFGDLLTAPPHATVPHTGIELPISQDAVDVIGRLLKQAWSALPPSVSGALTSDFNRFLDKISKDIPVPILSLWTAVPATIGDVQNLLHELSLPDKDWVQVGLDGANALLDVANVVDPDLAEPLQTGIALTQAILATRSVVQTVGGFLDL